MTMTNKSLSFGEDGREDEDKGPPRRSHVHGLSRRYQMVTYGLGFLLERSDDGRTTGSKLSEVFVVLFLESHDLY